MPYKLETPVQKHVRIRTQLEQRAWELRGQLDAVQNRWERHHEWLRDHSTENTDYDWGDVLA